MSKDIDKSSGSSLVKFVGFAQKFLDEYEAAGFVLEVYDNNDTEDLRDVVLLDKQAFGSHETISLEDLQIIAKKGLVLGIRNDQGKLVAEASMLLKSDPDYGKSVLERQLPEYLAYCNGSSVDVSEKGKGLENQLLRGREIRAIEVGKEAISTVVRHRNLPSIQSLMAEGYVIISGVKHYFGDSPEDARLILVKLLSLPSPMDVLRADKEELAFNLRGITTINDLQNSISQKQDIISLEVENSSEVDEEFNGAVERLLEKGYAGVSCHYIGVADSEGSSSSVMVFIRLDSVEADVFPAMIDLQAELSEIFKGTDESIVS